MNPKELVRIFVDELKQLDALERPEWSQIDDEAKLAFFSKRREIQGDFSTRGSALLSALDAKELAALTMFFCRMYVDSRRAIEVKSLLHERRIAGDTNRTIKRINMRDRALEKLQCEAEKFRQARRKGADATHAENRAMKAEVFSWLDSNMGQYKSMDAAAQVIAGKVAPIAFRTARDWVGEWKKLRSASTP